MACKGVGSLTTKNFFQTKLKSFIKSFALYSHWLVDFELKLDQYFLTKFSVFLYFSILYTTKEFDQWKNKYLLYFVLTWIRINYSFKKAPVLLKIHVKEMLVQLRKFFGKRSVMDSSSTKIAVWDWVKNFTLV